MTSTQMEEQKECVVNGSRVQSGSQNHVPSLHFFKLRPSPEEIKKEEADKEYQLLTLDRSCINEDINQLKVDQQQINRKLMWFTQHDQYIKWKTEEINNLRRYLGKVEPHLPTNSVPRTTRYLCLPENNAEMHVSPDRKRCQKKLIKKGRIDMDYVQQVKEELLSVNRYGEMTSSGTQEIDDVIESMAQRIRHGNKSRVDEMRLYLEMRNVMETREMYTAPEPYLPSNWYSIERPSKYDVDSKRSVQHKINIRLDDIEDMKMDLKGRKARVARLKSELELVRKSIRCLQWELEDVNTKRIKAYNRAYELGV